MRFNEVIYMYLKLKTLLKVKGNLNQDAKAARRNVLKSGGGGGGSLQQPPPPSPEREGSIDIYIYNKVNEINKLVYSRSCF